MGFVFIFYKINLVVINRQSQNLKNIRKNEIKYEIYRVPKIWEQT